jgi:hypothetical protein
MGKYYFFYVIDIDYPHENDKICMNLEREPEERSKYRKLYKVISKYRMPNEKDKNEDYSYRQYSLVSDAIRDDCVCNRCCWFIQDTFGSKMRLDEYCINHSNRNPICNSDWFISNIYYFVGEDTDLYNESGSAFRIFKYEDISKLKKRINENSPERENDQDAYNETLHVINWMEEMYAKYADKNIEILYMGDLY